MPNFTSPNSQPGGARRPRGTAHRLWSQRTRETTVDALGNHHASKGTSIGGQFIAKPDQGSVGAPGAAAGMRAAGLAPPRQSSDGSSPTTGSASALDALKSGSVSDSSALGGGVNTTLMITLDDGTRAVFKPEVGEAWNLSFANHDIKKYITNRDLPLAEREAMAYEVDTMLGIGLVPETVHRTALDGVDVENMEPSEDDDAPPDEDYLREQYDEYKEQNLEKAMEGVGEKMYEKFGEDQQDYVSNVKKRVSEIEDIYNSVLNDHPEFDDDAPQPYGHRSALLEHPKLGTGFTRKGAPNGGIIDPLDIISAADINVDGPLTKEEKHAVRNHILNELRGGAQEMGTLDEEAAAEKFTYDEWLPNHADTENRLLSSELESFEAWVGNQGYDISAVRAGRSNPIKNPDAKNPTGGSLQAFKELTTYGTVGDSDDDQTEYFKFAALDYAIGSMDRHHANVLFEDLGDVKLDGHDVKRAVAIDNGYSMPASTYATLRSQPVSEWLMFARRNPDLRNTPEAFRRTLERGLRLSNFERFVESHPGMDGNEREAFLTRIERLRRAAATPQGLYQLWSGSGAPTLM